MVTAERVYEVFGITPGPWLQEGRAIVAMTQNCRPNGEVIGNMNPSISTLLDLKEEMNNSCCASSSPDMLVGLVNIAIRFDPPMRDDRGAAFYIAVKVIESADSQKRKWPELLKELER